MPLLPKALSKVVVTKPWGNRPDQRNMKILLQHTRTRLYFRGLGDWTANTHDAFDFQHSQKAIDFARQNCLTSVHIAVKFIDGQFDEVFPLPTAMAVAQQHAAAAA